MLNIVNLPDLSANRSARCAVRWRRRRACIG